MNDRRGNVARVLAEMFVTSKLTIIVILATTVFGLAAIYLTPREENPQIIVPSAKITVQWPGASSLEVEQLIVTPLEAVVGEITGVEHTSGTAANSVGIVQVQFRAGESKSDSLVKLYDRVFSNLDKLPDDAGTPVVRAIDVDDMPVLTVTLASAHYDDYALKRMADRMAERLNSLPAVSVVSVKGGQNREIRVNLDMDRIAAYGIPLSRAHDTLAAYNLSQSAGGTVNDGTYRSVFLDGFFKSASDVSALIVGQNDGRPIYLGDIANVSDGPPTERQTLSRFSFGAGDARYSEFGNLDMATVTLGVAKKQGANAVVMANDTIARVALLQAEILPHHVQVVVTRNNGDNASDAVNLLIEHFFIAVVVVLFVLVLFLGWREALIVTLTVPLVLFVTIGADFLFGLTVNRVSLFALILALGLLVDDAIVVIENIHRRFHDNSTGDRRQITVDAAAEVGGAANLATATVMAVFLSLMLLSGMPGQYFFPVAFNVPVAMAASLFFAYTVTPWASHRWLTIKSEHRTKKTSMFLLSRGYRGLMRLMLNRAWARWLMLSLPVLALLITLLLPTWQFIRPEGVAGPRSPLGVALGFLPKDNKNTFSVFIQMPQSTPVETTDRLTREINAILIRQPLVVNTQSWVGQSGVADFNALLRGSADLIGQNIAEIRVNLINKHARNKTSIELVRELRPHIVAIAEKYPDTIVQMVEDPPALPMRAMVLAEIYGKDPKVLRDLASRTEKLFADTYDMVDISNSEPFDVTEYKIVVDQAKAALSGVSTAQIAKVLLVLFNGEIVGSIHPEGEKHAVSIRVQVPASQKLEPEHLEKVLVENADGQNVALAELVHVIPGLSDRPILHKDNERVVFVGGELAETSPLYAIADLDRRVNALDLGDGIELKTGNLNLVDEAPDTVGKYHLLWNGEIRLMLDIYREMLVVLGLAIMLIYLLLVAYYRSFMIPVAAMATLPLGLIGVFPGHWLLGTEFSATSIIGIVALAGVSVRSALLIIDFIRENQRQGMNFEEAVCRAGIIRARPIVLTAIAVVLGSAIMLTDPVFSGLAISLIFGTVISSLLTVVFVPVLYARVARK